MTGGWLVRIRRQEDPRLLLVCFPHAGGGSSVFAGWADLLPPGVELCAVRPPGRESRIRQRAYTRAADLIDDLDPVLAAYLGRTPFVLFGHSMGALLAFEYARRLAARDATGPRHLLVAGRRAPQLPHVAPIVHDRPDEVFLARLRALGGVSEELLADPAVMRMVSPGLRADFELNDTYAYRTAAPLRCPLTAFGGTSDPHVDPDGLAAWEEQTVGGFGMHLLPGGHFFLHSSRDLLLSRIACTVREAADR